MGEAKKNHTTFPVGVNVFVVLDGKLLLGKRKNAVGAGTWGLPGGHLEYKEGVKKAAARELFEETGLVASSLTFNNIVNNIRHEGSHYLQIGLLAEGVSGEPILKEPDKCSEWRWFGLDKLPDSIFIGHRAQIAAFKSGLSFFDDAE